MSDVDLDLTALRLAKVRVDNALTTFDSAEQVGDDLAALAGEYRLEAKIRDFAGNWDYNRGKLEEQLTGVRDWLDAIIETYEELDASMANPEDAP